MTDCFDCQLVSRTLGRDAKCAEHWEDEWADAVVKSLERHLESLQISSVDTGPLELSREDLETPRTAKEICAWVESINNHISGSASATSDFLLRRGFFKQFADEILPLWFVARAFFLERNDVVFAPTIGNQNFDVELRDSATGVVLQYMEVTRALDGVGKDAFLDRQQLARHGYACSHPEIPVVEREEVRKRLRSAVTKKVKNSYPRDTWLVVSFDDGMLWEESHRVEVEDFARTGLLPLLGRMAGLYLVGEREPREGPFVLRLEA